MTGSSQSNPAFFYLRMLQIGDHKQEGVAKNGCGLFKFNAVLS